MPLQNRVTPFGELIVTPARGTLMGNRGGRMHADHKTLGSRRWASRQWICCVLAFKGRHRQVWGEGSTELFFLDEVTALAAGHRPCFECRREDAERFAALFPVHSRVSWNSESQSQRSQSVALGPRLRGDERRKGERASAGAMG